jgi:glycosyltransferase involved in cell wall biosynthesis
MRILMLNYNVAFVGGGSFFRSWQWGRHLARRGHAVTLVATAPRSLLRIRQRCLEGVELVEMPGLLPRRWRYGYDPYEVARRMGWVARRRFDIVHALECRPVVIYPALLARRRGARLVIDWFDWFGRGGSVELRPNLVLRTILRPIETYYEQAFRRRADATVVVNSVLEKRALQLGVPAATILRSVHGADVEGLRPMSVVEARRDLGLPADVPIVGYVGSLFREDAEMLTAAFRRVRQACPDARLLLIGHSKAAVPLGEAEGALRTGFVDYQALNRYLAACDVMALPLADSPANQGRWPSKLMDYMAAGRPTVACDVAGVGPAVTEAHAGLAARPEAAHLAEQLLTVLRDGELAERMARNARRAAETRYGWPVLTGQLEALYASLLAQSQPERDAAPI